MRFARGDVRDHIASNKKYPPTFISPLRRVAAVKTTKNQLSRDFRCSSILDFFNSIGAKQTSTSCAPWSVVPRGYAPTGDADMIYLAERFPDPANVFLCCSKSFLC